MFGWPCAEFARRLPKGHQIAFGGRSVCSEVPGATSDHTVPTRLVSAVRFTYEILESTDKAKTWAQDAEGTVLRNLAASFSVSCVQRIVLRVSANASLRKLYASVVLLLININFCFTMRRWGHFPTVRNYRPWVWMSKQLLFLSAWRPKFVIEIYFDLLLAPPRCLGKENSDYTELVCAQS